MNHPDILDLIDDNIKSELQENWTTLRFCYWEIERDIYKLYDLDTSAEIRINSMLDLYELYEESDMRGTWTKVFHLAEEIRNYFEDEVLKVIERKRIAC